MVLIFSNLYQTMTTVIWTLTWVAITIAMSSNQEEEYVNQYEYPSATQQQLLQPEFEPTESASLIIEDQDNSMNRRSSKSSCRGVCKKGYSCLRRCKRKCVKTRAKKELKDCAFGAKCRKYIIGAQKTVTICTCSYSQSCLGRDCGGGSCTFKCRYGLCSGDGICYQVVEGEPRTVCTCPHGSSCLDKRGKDLWACRQDGPCSRYGICKGDGYTICSCPGSQVCQRNNGTDVYCEPNGPRCELNGKCQSNGVSTCDCPPDQSCTKKNSGTDVYCEKELRDCGRSSRCGGEGHENDKPCRCPAGYECTYKERNSLYCNKEKLRCNLNGKCKSEGPNSNADTCECPTGQTCTKKNSDSDFYCENELPNCGRASRCGGEGHENDTPCRCPAGYGCTLKKGNSLYCDRQHCHLSGMCKSEGPNSNADTCECPTGQTCSRKRGTDLYCFGACQPEQNCWTCNRADNACDIVYDYNCVCPGGKGCDVWNETANAWRCADS